jgi:hypothetical protein
MALAVSSVIVVSRSAVRESLLRQRGYRQMSKVMSGGGAAGLPDADWIRDNAVSAAGTTVWMRLRNRTSRTTKGIFDEFVSGDDYDFSRTVVPVVLAQYAPDPLISRSQAKR